MMHHPKRSVGLLIAAAAFLTAACQDSSVPTTPPAPDRSAAGSAGVVFQEQDLAAWFDDASPVVLALPGTVFADHDEAAGRLVFGVRSEAAAPGVRKALSALEIPGSAYRVEVTEPIRFLASTLRDEFRPTVGGVQIHFGNYVCTLGFNADRGGVLSFVTNSHCSDRQGSTDGTTYYQPSSSVAPTPIAVEVDDPDYFKGGECPRGRKCRYSDAARARYESGVEVLSALAEPTGVNDGSIDVTGSTLDVAGKDAGTRDFAGETLNKVGRTTGWTRGDVTYTCMDVNVAGSNITLLCQTAVSRDGTVLAAGGDSGSPVFRSGSGSVELVGILWGGSSSGELFVFSPFEGIERELGPLDVVSADGTGSGSGSGGGGGDDGGGGGSNCPPGNPDHKNCT